MSYKAIKVNGKKVDEHRYIMEQHLGRKLQKTEVVHHKNGDKTDNRLDNLEVIDLSEHSRMHMTNKPKSLDSRQKMSESKKGHTQNRVLSEPQVQEIYNLHQQGISQRKIATLMGTNHSTVGRILRGEYYKGTLAR